jgi:hypothetical protein
MTQPYPLHSSPRESDDHYSLGGLSVASHMSSLAQQMGSLTRASSVDRKLTLGGGTAALFQPTVPLLGPLPTQIAVNDSSVEESKNDSMESLLEWDDDEDEEKYHSNGTFGCERRRRGIPRQSTRTSCAGQFRGVVVLASDAHLDSATPRSQGLSTQYLDGAFGSLICDRRHLSHFVWLAIPGHAGDLMLCRSCQPHNSPMRRLNCMDLASAKLTPDYSYICNK